MNLNTALNKFPLTSVIALVFVAVGGYLALDGQITYEDYLIKTGAALGGLGIVGIARTLDKYRESGTGPLD